MRRAGVYRRNRFGATAVCVAAAPSFQGAQSWRFLFGSPAASSSLWRFVSWLRRRSQAHPLPVHFGLALPRCRVCPACKLLLGPDSPIRPCSRRAVPANRRLAWRIGRLARPRRRLDCVRRSAISVSRPAGLVRLAASFAGAGRPQPAQSVKLIGRPEGFASCFGPWKPPGWCRHSGYRPPRSIPGSR